MPHTVRVSGQDRNTTNARRRIPAEGSILLLWVLGCGGNAAKSIPSTTVQPTPQNYFAPAISGTSEGATATASPQIFTIDDTGNTFSNSTFALNPIQSQVGAQVINAGILSAGMRGLRDLSIAVHYAAATNSSGITQFQPTTYNPPVSGSFAVELANQAGGLVQIAGQPAVPLVAATTCPSATTAQSYQFITIPASSDLFNPATDTAYGSVDITASGSAVTMKNIHQFTLPSEGGSRAPAVPVNASVTGTCGPTAFGTLTNIPGQAVVTGVNPNDATPQAELGIGPTGLLVEDNGSSSGSRIANDVLGGGTGAIGLPKPTSAIDTASAVGTQYLGFIYSAGVLEGSNSVPSFTSHLASFGFSSIPSSCASVAPSTSTLIYGGDFTKDHPSGSAGGFGNCNFAIDLGGQDSTNNGLYPHATVWVGASYQGNTTGATYSFPAVAIIGQLGGKYGMFLIGMDSTQPWSIYLLQSN